MTKYLAILVLSTLSYGQKQRAVVHNPCNTFEGKIYHSEPGWRCSYKKGWYMDTEAKAQDEADLKICQDAETRRQELVKSARTRILTDDEFNTLYSSGFSVLLSMECHPNRGNIWYETSYNDNEMQKAFDELLAQQFRLRIIKERGGK